MAHVAWAVTDSGIGMTSAQKARLFERFYRADPRATSPAPGWACALVHEIMELQGGRIEVDSEPGIGTRVTLWFLLAELPLPGHGRARPDAIISRRILAEFDLTPPSR